MCAINISSEAGDAAINIMSTRRKYSTVSGMENSKDTFLLERDKNPVLQFVSTIPANSIDLVKDNGSDECMMIPGYPLQTTDVKYEADYYRFPCYSFQDAVLVKDVGVSCSLLNENIINSNIISEVEDYLIRQLKLEYNELSNITKKINACTKDILNHLAIKSKKKDQTPKKLRAVSRHVLTSHHADETGNPCLKLRFCDNINNINKKYLLPKADSNYDHFEKEIDRGTMYDTYFLIQDKNKEKHRVEIDETFLKEVFEFSPKCSGVLFHNYLIMKKEKVSGNASKMPLHKPGNLISSSNAYRNHNVNKFFYTTKCDPSVLTNWREVSRRKDCKFKNAFTAGTSSKSRRTVILDSYSV